MRKLAIPSAAALQDLEALHLEIEQTPADEGIEITLPRNLDRRFFLASKVVGLLVTAAQRGKLVVRDTHHVWTAAETLAYFRSSVPAMAALSYAREVTNAKKESCPLSRQKFWDEINAAGGRLEPPASEEADPTALSGNAVTFCALDPGYSEPGILAGFTEKKDSFIKWFIGLRLLKEYLGKLPPMPGPAQLVSPQWRFAEYVYEIYSNTWEHGRRTTDGTPIPGLRFVSLQKHFAVNAAQLKRYAKDFGPLEEYIGAVERYSRNQRLFCEVSVSDQGMGILDHFVAARPETATTLTTESNRLALLRSLLREPLTSKRNRAGAGGGLQNAYNACKLLHAFVTVRTGRYWLYANFPPGEASGPGGWLEVAPGKSLPRVAGTHFSALIPLDLKPAGARP
jgi:hypothetical protein